MIGTIQKVGSTTSGPTTVVVVGEIDLGDAERLERALREPLEHGSDVVADLRSVSFIDCSGLRAILRAARVGAREGRTVALRPSAAVDRLFDALDAWHLDGTAVLRRVDQSCRYSRRHPTSGRS